MKTKYEQGWRQLHMDQGKAPWTWQDFTIIAAFFLILVGSFYITLIK